MQRKALSVDANFGPIDAPGPAPVPARRGVREEWVAPSRESRWIACMACGVAWTAYVVVGTFFQLGVIGNVFAFAFLIASLVAGARLSGVGVARTWGLVAVVVLSPVVAVGFFTIAAAPMMQGLLKAQAGDYSWIEKVSVPGMMARMIGIGFVLPIVLAITAIAVLARRAALGVGLTLVWLLFIGANAVFMMTLSERLESGEPITPESLGAWPAVIFVAACWAASALWFVFTPPRADAELRVVA